VVGGVLRVADRGWPEVRLWDVATMSALLPTANMTPS